MFVACQKEEALTPSDIDNPNWIVIHDDPSDPIQHQRYLIYKNYNVSVYFNDTLGQEERIDNSGDKYTYYELLRPFHIPTGYLNGDTITSFLTKSEIALQERLFEKLGSDFIEKLPEIFNVRNILFVNKMQDRLKKDIRYFLGYNTVVVSEVDSYTDTFWNDLRIKICIDMALADYAWERDHFYTISNNLSSSTNSLKAYSKGEKKEFDMMVQSGYGWDYIYQWMATSPVRINGSNCLEDVGFLSRNPGDPNIDDPEVPKKDWMTPVVKADLEDYTDLLFNNSEAEVIEKYGNYPVVMKKYYVFKARFEAFGITFE